MRSEKLEQRSSMEDGKPICVLLSPEEYVAIKDETEDAKLLALAYERMADFDPETLIF